ncbi:MAG TPA: hypothetical protein VM553_05430 [Dongiaceae bacterium]|nr:hypothetical protein [Dongiaceae bacterium]
MKRMMQPLIVMALLGSAAPVFVTQVFAEEVAVPAGQQGDSSVDRPRTGLSMDQVSARFGNPDQQLPAIGNPPITRWVYASYTVYFESNHVIHSVLNATP